MVFWVYLPSILVWALVAGRVTATSACGNCEENGDSLECLHSINGEEYRIKILSEGKALELECKPSARMLNFSSIEDCNFLDVEQVQIHGCPLPNATFGEVFFQLGIYPENVTSFGFFNKNEGEELLENWHLEGLVSLVTLELVNNGFRALPEDLFIPTPNLISLKVVSNYFSTLPESLFFNTPELETIHLASNDLESLPNLLFTNLSSLVSINMSHNYINELHPDFFVDNPNLKSLDLSHNHISQLERDLFKDLRSLKNLSLQGNVLTALPEGIFFNLVSLENLDLSSNILEHLPNKTFDRIRNVKMIHLGNNSLSKLPDEVFQNCKSLETLSLSYNNLQTLQSEMFPMPDTSLMYLDLGHNNLSFTPKRYKIIEDRYITHDDFPLSRQTELKEVLLNDNAIVEIPHAFNRLFVNLVNIDLSGNAIEYLAFHSLHFLQNSVTLSLKNNYIKLIDFHDMYSILNMKKVRLFLSGNDLLCNCRIYRFIRVVQGLSIGLVNNLLTIIVEDIDEVACHNQHNELEILPEVDTRFLTCSLPDRQCIDNCTCLWRPYDKMLIVNCSYQGLQELPNLRNLENVSVTLNLKNNSLTSLKGLHDPHYAQVVNLTLSNNRISFINKSDIPETLKILDVRGNILTTLPEPLLEFLNATDIILSLGENPWNCDCDLINFLNFLHVPLRKVTDFVDIKCVDGSDSLLDLTEYSLCPFFMQPMVIVTIVAIAMFLLLFAVLGTVSFYKYKQGIKVWLFAHRMCLWAITEDEMDANKIYDAFISYSHKDEEFVNTVLVPGLESGDPKYRICLHYRDWMPGEYIQNQILQSVEASRRTIVVLSSNFIESVWGQLEFKAAHSQALQDRTNRIIVIVYGKIPPESELDEKLQLYISMKTYIKWGDAKFWEKLRYSMPHPPELTRRHRKRRDTDKLELVKSISKGST